MHFIFWFLLVYLIFDLNKRYYSKKAKMEVNFYWIEEENKKKH